MEQTETAKNLLTTFCVFINEMVMQIIKYLRFVKIILLTCKKIIPCGSL